MTHAAEPQGEQPDAGRPWLGMSQDPTPDVGEHAAEEGAPLHPLIDLSRDPTPGVADHARDDEDD